MRLARTALFVVLISGVLAACTPAPEPTVTLDGTEVRLSLPIDTEK